MAEIQSLSQIFKGIILRIPDYQRGYSWGESEIEALWRDLETTTPSEEIVSSLGVVCL